MTDDLYGSKSSSIQELREAIQRELGVVLKHRKSYYKGDYYLSDTGLGDEEISLQPNYIYPDGEEEIVYSEFSEYHVLLWVSDSPRGEEIEKRLKRVPGLELLSRSPA